MTAGRPPIYQHVFAPLAAPKTASLMFAIAALLLLYVILEFLYRRRWFSARLIGLLQSGDFMRTILVTNDDGFFSPGIIALADALRPLGDVITVAPQTEASAVGHALTLRRPLRLEQERPGVYSVDGTPTDCVNIAIDKLLKQKPDIVVSGINKGLNIGDDVTYSGTVAGALEGALLGYQAIAISLAAKHSPDVDFGPAAQIAAGLAAALLERPLPGRTFLNVNVPHGEIRGVRVTVQAKRNHITKVAQRVDPRRRPYFWIEEASDDWEADPRSDHQAVVDKFVSVTPIQPDLTDHSALDLVDALMRGTGLAPSR